MKFDVSSSDLLKKLQLAAGALSPNPVFPLLEDFLFRLDGNALTIISTNLEVTIISKLDVTGSESGSIAVPGKIILETLKALPDQPINFTVDEDQKGIKITSSYGQYKLAGDDPADFPETPAEEGVSEIMINSDALLRAINRTIFATSNDEIRLAMTGVYMMVDFNKIVFVATDAHKLVKYTVGGISSDISDSIIIPKKILSQLKSSLPEDESIRLSFNKKNVFFSFGDTRLVSRLIDAKYPDYNAVIPANNTNILTIDTSDFQHSLRRNAIYANKTTNQVVLNLAENSLTLSAQDLDFSNEATEQLPCSYDGDPLTIGFSAKFLIEMLSNLGTPSARFEFSDYNKAGILLPSENESNEELLMLIMPVMTS